MNEISIVFGKHLKAYLNNKGTVVFHLCILAAIGFVSPFFIRNDMVLLNAAFFFSLTLLKQWSLESFSEEKERRTLETLLSSPIRTRNLYYGKCAYCFFTGCGYFLIIMILMISVKGCIQVPLQLSPAAAACLLLLYVQTSLFITLAGTQVSIYSENITIANSRFFIPFYAVYFYLFLVITLFTQKLETASYLLSIIFLGATLIINLVILLTKVNKLSRHTFLIK